MSKEYCFFCMEPLQKDMSCSNCHRDNNVEAPIHHIKPGTVLRDKYMIGKAIGEGGFGITYIGRDLTLDMRIAVKEYYPNGYSNRNHLHSNEVTLIKGNSNDDYEKNMDRFLSEARILARFCDEPGIVGVRDFFKANGTAYIVMDYLDGITLKKYIDKYGPIPAETLLPMIDPILEALSDIHKQGLIHRDISPDNIMMLKNGRLKLLDFGAARKVTADKSLSVMLKPGYAPEEQYRTKGKQGAWTDVYAMCATIYKCITGITPDESIQRVFDDELKTPSQMGISMPKAWETALMQGLKVKSNDRIQNMDLLRRAFNPECIEDINNINVSRQDSNMYFKVREELDEPLTIAGSDADEPKTQMDDGGRDDNKTVQESEVVVSSDPGDVKIEKVKIGKEENETAEQLIPEAKESKDDKPSSEELDVEDVFDSIKKIKDSKKTKKPQKKGLYILAGLVAAVLLIVFIMIVGSTSGQSNLKDTLPTQRMMADDCSDIIKAEGINGSVLELEVLDENLNEKFKTYKVQVNCQVKEASTTIGTDTYYCVLLYEYEEGIWVLNMSQSEVELKE